MANVELKAKSLAAKSSLMELKSRLFKDHLPDSMGRKIFPRNYGNQGIFTLEKCNEAEGWGNMGKIFCSTDNYVTTLFLALVYKRITGVNTNLQLVNNRASSKIAGFDSFLCSNVNNIYECIL